MYKSESVHENNTRKIMWNFEIQTHHRMPPRIPDFVLINKKKITCHLEFCCSCEQQSEKKTKKNG